MSWARIHTFLGSLGAKSKRATQQVLFYVLSLCMIFNPVLVHAQTVPDASVPATAPSMDVAPNGVPVVNITAPSAAGVSHNRFQSLNIDAQGLIFNNSKVLGTSNLGGVVLANPNLVGNTARIILNEVTGATSSDLNGFAEVFGDQAEFVLANPNGISCNGCGFINTDRITLTTGLPNLAGGDLISLDVDGSGVLSVDGAGLNAADADVLDLLARTIILRAPVNAKDLQVLAGRNLMDYGTRVVTVKADDGSVKPALAIDGTHLGAMYANRINVIATEDGVGVKLPENMATGNGDITITADGGIELTNATSDQDLTVTSNTGDVTVSGTLSGQELTVTSTAGDADISGTLVSEDDITVTANGDIELNNATSGQALTLTANTGDVTMSGTLTSEGDLTVTGRTVTNDGTVTAGMDSGGVLVAGATLNMTASQDLVNNDKLQATAAITLEATNGAITNSNGADIISQGTFSATADTTLTNAGSISSDSTASLSAADIDNENGSVTAGDSLTLTADTLIDNRNGFLRALDVITLWANTIINSDTEGADEGIKSDTTIALNTDRLTNTDGLVVSTEALTVTGKTAGQKQILTSGKLISGESVTVSAAAIESSADIEAQTTIAMTGTIHKLTNTGDFQAGGNVTLTANNNTVTNSGTIETPGDITVSTETLKNQSTGLLDSGNDVFVSASTKVSNAGVISAQNNLTIETDILENVQGALLAVNKITLSDLGNARATRIANRSGVIETLNNNISILASSFINERQNFSITPQQEVYSQWESTYVPFSHPSNNGVISSYLDYNYGGGTLYFAHPDDDEWHIYYDYGNILVRQYEDVINGSSPAAYLSSGAHLTVNATDIDNRYSYISADGNIAMTGSTLENTGQILRKVTTVHKSWGEYDRCQSNKGCPWLLNGAGTATLSDVATGSAEGLIQAGGSFTGSFTGQIDNTTILGAVADGDLIEANQVIADVKEAPTLTELAELSLVDVFNQLPARGALVQLAPPGAQAVYEMRFEFTTPSVVLGGQYFLDRADVDIAAIPNRFAFNQALEERVIQNAIRLKSGKRWLDPAVQDPSLQLKQLVDSGLAAQADLQLTVGVTLSKDQISRLNQNIVWYVEEEINGERVLAPRLYLASTDAIAFGPDGASIEAKDINLAATTIYNSGDITATDGDATITATEDLTIQSGRVNATGDITLNAGRDLSIVTDTTEVNTLQGGSQTLVGRKAWVEADGTVTIGAGQNLAILGADVKARTDAEITAGDNLVIGSIAVNEQVNYGDEANHDRWRKVTNRGSSIEAGDDIATTSGGSTVVQASTLDSDDDIDVLAGGSVEFSAARDTFDYQSQRGGGKKFGTENSVDHVRTQVLAGGNVRITSVTGDITSEAARFEAHDDVTGGTVTLNATNGEVALLSVTDEHRSTYQSSSSNAVTQKARDKGNVDTNVVMTEVDAEGGLIINVADPATGKGGIRVEIRDTGSLEGNIAALSEVPGLEYLADLQKRDDVDWKQIKEIHDSWDNKSQGLSGPATAVIALAVAIAVGPQIMAALQSTAVAGAAGTVTTSAFATTTVSTAGVATTSLTTLGTAVSAGLSTLATQATTAVATNGGDMNAAFSQLMSNASLRSLATSIVTAGVLNGALPVDLKAKVTSLDLAQQIQLTAIRTSVDTATNSLINGVPLSDALKSSLISNAGNVIGAELAQDIGEAYKEAAENGVNPLEYAGHKLAHAALGCGMASAGGANCGAGATGAVAAEITGEIYFSESQVKEFEGELTSSLANGELTKDQALAQVSEWQADGVDLSRLAAGLSVFLIGGDEEEVNAGANAGANAIENNLCGTGACAIAAGLLIPAIYATIEGDGNPIRGIDTILAGEDMIARLASSAVEAGVEEAFAVTPELTRKTLETLAEAGELANTVITYMDDKTGNVVSSNWNSLDPDTQQNLKRAGFVVGAIAGAAVTTLRATKNIAKVDLPDPTKKRVSGPSVNGPSVNGPEVKVVSGPTVSGPKSGVKTKIDIESLPTTDWKTWSTQAAQSATKNPTSDTVVLGRFSELGVSYNRTARKMNASYYEIDNWKDVEKALGRDQLWDLNKTFLEQQRSQGKKIVLTHNPNDVNPKSFFGREVNWLKKDFTFKPESNGTWVAVPKTIMDRLKWWK